MDNNLNGTGLDHIFCPFLITGDVSIQLVEKAKKDEFRYAVGANAGLIVTVITPGPGRSRALARSRRCQSRGGRVERHHGVRQPTGSVCSEPSTHINSCRETEIAGLESG